MTTVPGITQTDLRRRPLLRYGYHCRVKALPTGQDQLCLSDGSASAVVNLGDLVGGALGRESLRKVCSLSLGPAPYCLGSRRESKTRSRKQVSGIPRSSRLRESDGTAPYRTHLGPGQAPLRLHLKTHHPHIISQKQITELRNTPRDDKALTAHFGHVLKHKGVLMLTPQQPLTITISKTATG